MKNTRMKKFLTREQVYDVIRDFAATGFASRDAVIAEHALSLIEAERGDACFRYTILRQIEGLQKEVAALTKVVP